MKNNMKLACLLLALVLVTSCMVGGSFAKYVTSATANDAARVAKWGIEIATWNTDAEKATLFSADYDTTVTASNGTDLLVAPGTKNTNTATFSIKGTPEVDFKLDFVMNVTNDVVVPKGDYLDWTTGNSTTDTFKVENDYHPVVFTLTQTKTTASALKLDAPVTGNLADIKAAFEKLSQATVNANTALDEEWTLTWVYDFDANGAGTNDKADTLLGNNAAGIASDADVSTQLTYDISITATQID